MSGHVCQGYQMIWASWNCIQKRSVQIAVLEKGQKYFSVCKCEPTDRGERMITELFFIVVCTHC